MKNLLHVLTCLSLISLISCNDGAVGSLGPIGSAYINEYLSPDSIKREPIPDFNEGSLYLSVNSEFYGQVYGSDGRDQDGWPTKENKIKFDQLAKANGDTLFDRPLTYGYGQVFLDTVASIHITSTPGFFDDSSSSILDEEFLIGYDMPVAFIKNGYKDKEEMRKKEYLTDFNEASKPFMGSDFYLLMAAKPYKSGVYDFTATITFTNGKSFELPYSSVEMSAN